MLIEEIEHRGLRPVGVRVAQEARELVRVVGPLRVEVSEFLLVARLRCVHELDGDHDVLLQDPGERVPVVPAVERDDRVADVLLVLEQPAGRRVGFAEQRSRRLEDTGRRGHARRRSHALRKLRDRIGLIRDGGHDVEPRPDHVIGP